MQEEDMYRSPRYEVKADGEEKGKEGVEERRKKKKKFCNTPI